MQPTLAQLTGIPVIDFFLDLLGSYGYLITFLGTVLENVFIVGSVTPGEIIVMASGYISSLGPLQWWGVWLASVIGTMVGSNISYILGRKGGRQAILRYGTRFHISEQRMRDAEAYFEVHGSKTVFLARFAAGVKNWVPMIAGASRMRLAWFEGWTFLGAVVYTTAMVALGYFFGTQFDRLLKWVTRAGYVGLAILVGLVVLALWGRRRIVQHRRAVLAEEVAEKREAGDDADG